MFRLCYSWFAYRQSPSIIINSLQLKDSYYLRSELHMEIPGESGTLGWWTLFVCQPGGVGPGKVAITPNLANAQSACTWFVVLLNCSLAFPPCSQLLRCLESLTSIFQCVAFILSISMFFSSVILCVIGEPESFVCKVVSPDQILFEWGR